MAVRVLFIRGLLCDAEGDERNDTRAAVTEVVHPVGKNGQEPRQSTCDDLSRRKQ